MLHRHSTLQPGGYLLLKRLGLAHCCEGIGAQKVGVRTRLEVWEAATAGNGASLHIAGCALPRCQYVDCSSGAAMSAGQGLLHVEVGAGLITLRPSPHTSLRLFFPVAGQGLLHVQGRA